MPLPVILCHYSLADKIWFLVIIDHQVLSRISVLGSAFLAVLAAGPAVIEQTTHLTAFRGFAGTSILILVGCATDTARKVQAEIISQKYKNIEFYDIDRYGLWMSPTKSMQVSYSSWMCPIRSAQSNEIHAFFFHPCTLENTKRKIRFCEHMVSWISSPPPSSVSIFNVYSINICKKTFHFCCCHFCMIICFGY